MKTLNTIFAIIGAAAAGAAVGLLFAPKSGADSRKEIADFIKEKCPAIKKNKLDALADRIAEEIKEA